MNKLWKKTYLFTYVNMVILNEDFGSDADLVYKKISNLSSNYK